MTGNVADETAKRAQAAIAGHRGDIDAARSLLADPAGSVRATALGALARCDALVPADLVAGLADPQPVVRRRACELAVGFAVDLVPLLADPDAGVVEAACWAMGERADAAALTPAVAALAGVATGHADPLCREAAVAALGAIGDDEGLPAILSATTDKPAVRRRAVIALAPFEGPDVDAALERALSDREPAGPPSRRRPAGALMYTSGLRR